MKQLSLIILLILILQGCSHTANVVNEREAEPESEVRYSAIFYIHGDADYLFHDRNGVAMRADEEAFLRAVSIAKKARSGEIFIIHQKPERKFLWLFPRKNNHVYYFREGHMKQHVRYRYKDNSQPFLAKESELFHQFSSENISSKKQTYFFFFGHEIDASNGNGYHRSLTGVDVSGASLSSALGKFLLEEQSRFDLVTLSTCSNGTPIIAEKLLPATALLLASPQNLHLSYLDAEGLLLLEDDPGVNPYEVAVKIANESFKRLKEDVQTEVALSLYDMNIVSNYINQLAGKVKEHESVNTPNRFLENSDCADLDFFDTYIHTEGIKTWYRAPAFGRRTSAERHSGWGCKVN